MKYTVTVESENCGYRFGFCSSAEALAAACVALNIGSCIVKIQKEQPESDPNCSLVMTNPN